MTNIKIGGRYRLAKHPDQPIGVVTDVDLFTAKILVVWENTNLIPPQDYYPESSFYDGTFVSIDTEEFTIIGGDPHCWSHDWIPYTGLREVYEFCKRCDMKRYKK